MSIGSLIPSKGTGRRIFALGTRPPRVRNTRDRRPPPLSERITPRACTCDGKSGLARCPYHLGRYSQPPRLDEGIPRIHGVSTGAWSLFLVVLRGIRWAIEKASSEGKSVRYNPGRLRLQRAVGGRNARTRPRDEHGRPGTGPSYEKGSCDPSTITAYLHELRCAILPNGEPLCRTYRHSGIEMDVWLHPDVVLHPASVYRVTMSWEHSDGGLGTGVPTPTPHTVGSGAGGSTEHAGSSLALSLEEPPYRLREGIEKWQAEVESEVRGLAVAPLAERYSWWPAFVEAAGSVAEARRDLRWVTRQLRRDGIPPAALVNVFLLLAHARERGHKAPRVWKAWMLKAARSGWAAPDRAPAPGEALPAPVVTSLDGPPIPDEAPREAGLVPAHLPAHLSEDLVDVPMSADEWDRAYREARLALRGGGDGAPGSATDATA